jgi:hypothetical protein
LEEQLGPETFESWSWPEASAAPRRTSSNQTIAPGCVLTLMERAAVFVADFGGAAEPFPFFCADDS